MRTPGMDDYLEQIYLLTREGGFTRVSEVAGALSVNKSSASRMAQKLGDTGYIVFERYGRIYLTDQGAGIGRQLLYRHQLLEKFLCLLGVPMEQIKSEVEQLEHHFSWNTLGRIQKLVHFFDAEPSVMMEYRNTIAIEQKRT